MFCTKTDLHNDDDLTNLKNTRNTTLLLWQKIIYIFFDYIKFFT